MLDYIKVSRVDVRHRFSLLVLDVCIPAKSKRCSDSIFNIAFHLAIFEGKPKESPVFESASVM